MTTTVQDRPDSCPASQPEPRSVPRISVLVIDENPVFLSAAVRLLELQGELDVVGASSLKAGLAAAKVRRPPEGFSVVVIDHSAAGTDGLGMVPRVRSALPGVGVVVLALPDSNAYRAAALAGGAHGFASKSNLTSELLTAIHLADRRRLETLQDMAVMSVACPS